MRQQIPRVEDTHSQRFNVALELFREGHPLNYKDIYIQRGESGNLRCSIGCSADIGKITLAEATTAIQRARALFEELTAQSSDFSALGLKQPEYSVYFDYGMGDLEVAKEVDGKLHLVKP